MNLNWLWTPRHLIATVAVLLLGSTLVLTVVTRGGSKPTIRPATISSPAAISPDAAVDTAVAFVESWCTLNGRTPQQWLTDVRGLSAGWLRPYWVFDSDHGPTEDCPYGQAKPRFTRPDQVRVFIVTKGNPVLVDVVSEGGRLVVSGITPDDEGGD